MANQNKNLNIKLKLDVDTSSSDKLVTLTKVIDDNIKDTINHTNELARAEAARTPKLITNAAYIEAIEKSISAKREESSKQQQEAYNKLQALLDKNNKALEEGVRWAGLIPANMQRAVDKYNSLQQVNNAINKTQIEILNYQKLQHEMVLRTISAEERINKIYSNRVQQIKDVNSLKFAQSGNAEEIKPIRLTGSYNYGTGGISSKVEQANQAAFDAAEKTNYNLVEKAIAARERLELKRTEDLVNLANARAARLAAEATKEIAAQEKLQQKQQEALNYRLSLEAKHNEELQTLLNKRQAERDEQARKQIEKERQLAEQIKQIKASYAQQALVDNTDVTKNNRDKELASLRASIEEQHRIRMAGFNNSLSQQEARLKSSIAVQTAEQVHGIQSIEAIRARAAELNIAQEQLRQTRLNNITQRVQTGTITPDAGVALAERANQRYAQSLIQTNTELQHHEDATKRVAQEHTNLFNRVGQLIGAYTIWNATISAIKAVPNIGIELESTKASLEATTGSAAGMGSVMIALEKEAKRTGIEIGTLRETFRGFQASTSLAGESIESTWHMFTNLNTVITGLHLPADKANGIFLAMAQIFNKTKVQSEELVKQLGNLLPGAFASFAAANNVAFGGQFKNSMDLIDQMKKGMVFAHETVERFTTFLAERFEPAFALASHGLNASIGRMKTSFTLLGESIYNMSSGILVSAIQNLDSFATYMRGAVEGTNNFGKVLKEVALISLSLFIGLMVKSLQTTIMNTAATIADTNAIAIRTAARRAEAIAAGIQIAAVERMTLATAASTIGMNLLNKAAMFLVSPAGILTGLTAIAGALYLFVDSAKSASNEVENFLKQTRENLSKVAEKPVTLEMRIDADPEVVKAKQAIANLQTTIERAKDITSGGNWIENIINKVSLNKDIHNLGEMKRLLVVLQEKAHININVENAEALKNIDEIAAHFHLLALQAKGLTKEAAEMQFDITNAAKMAELQKQINISEQEKTKEKVIQERYDKLQAERAAHEANLKANGTWGKPTFKSKEFSKAEIDALDAQYAALEINRQNRQKAQEAFDEAVLARNDIGIKDQEKQDVARANFKLKLQEDIYGKAKTLQEATAQAEAKAAIEANTRLKEQADTIRKIQNIKEESRTPAQKAELADNSNIIAQIEQAKQKTISDAVDKFNEEQKNKAKEHSSAISKINKDAYKDYERDAALIGLALETNLARESALYTDNLISIADYYSKRSSLQQAALANEIAVLEAEKNLASSKGDSAKVEQLADKQAALNAKRDTAAAQDARQRIIDERNYANTLADTNIQLQQIIGNTAEAARLTLAKQNEQVRNRLTVESTSTGQGATDATRAAAKTGLSSLNASEDIANLQAAAAQAQAYKDKIDSIKMAYIDMASETSTSLASTLGGFSSVLDGINSGTKAYQEQKIALDNLIIAAKELNTEKERTPDGKAREELDKKILINTEEQQVAQEKLYKTQLKDAGNTFASIEGMTDKNSKINKAAHTARMVMNGIEFAFKLKDMALNAASFAQNMANNAKDMAMSLIKIPINIAEGASKMFGQGGFAGFAGVALMMAVMAGLGFAASGGSSVQEPPKESADSGSVLGDKTAKSESIGNIANLLKDIHASEYKELRGINAGIGALQNSIVNAVTNVFRAGGLDLSNKGINLSDPSNAIMSLFGFGMFNGGYRDVTERGISTPAQQIANIDKSGFQAQQYNIVKTRTWDLFSDSTKFDTVMTTLDEKVTNSFSKIFSHTADSMQALAVNFGKDVQAKVNAYIIPALRINLTDLNAEDAIKKVNNVINTTLDDMATSVFGKIVGQYQALGEGMYYTANRVYAQMVVAKNAITRLGGTFPEDVKAGLALADALVQVSSSADTAAGKLSEFIQKETDFYKNFTSSGKQANDTFNSFNQALLDITNLQLDYVSIVQKGNPSVKNLATTFLETFKATGNVREAITAMNASLDLNTEAGREAHAALTSLNTDFLSIFDSITQPVTDAIDSIKNATQSLTLAELEHNIANVKDVEQLKTYTSASIKLITDKYNAEKKLVETLQSNITNLTDNINKDVNTLKGTRTEEDLNAIIKNPKTSKEDLVKAQTDLNTLIADRYKQERAYITSISDSLEKNSASILNDLDTRKEDKLLSDYRKVANKEVAKKTVEDYKSQADLSAKLQKLIMDRYNKEKDAIASIKQSFTELGKTVKDMLLGSLSTLDPQKKLEAAKASYDKLLADSKSKDVIVAAKAASQLGEASQSYLTEAQSFYGSTAKYAGIFDKVTTTLTNLSNSSMATDAGSQKALKVSGDTAAVSLAAMNGAGALDLSSLNAKGIQDMYDTGSPGAAGLLGLSQGALGVLTGLSTTLSGDASTKLDLLHTTITGTSSTNIKNLKDDLSQQALSLDNQTLNSLSVLNATAVSSLSGLAISATSDLGKLSIEVTNAIIKNLSSKTPTKDTIDKVSYNANQDILKSTNEAVVKSLNQLLPLKQQEQAATRLAYSDVSNNKSNPQKFIREYDQNAIAFINKHIQEDASAMLALIDTKTNAGTDALDIFNKAKAGKLNAATDKVGERTFAYLSDIAMLVEQTKGIDKINKDIATAENIIRNIKYKASGGITQGLTMVGEQGPELINFPLSTAVTNNTKTNSILENVNKHSDAVLVSMRKELIQSNINLASIIKIIPTTVQQVDKTKTVNSDEALNILTDMKKELIILNNRMETIERKTKLSKPNMSFA